MLSMRRQLSSAMQMYSARHRPAPVDNLCISYDYVTITF